MGKLMVAIGVRVNGNTKIVEWTHSHDTASFCLHWNDDFEYICSSTRYTSLYKLVESKYDIVKFPRALGPLCFLDVVAFS